MIIYDRRLSSGPVTNGASAWAAFLFYPEDADVLAQGARGSQGKRREPRFLVSRSMPEVRPGSERRRISFIGLEACVQLPMAPCSAATMPNIFTEKPRSFVRWPWKLIGRSLTNYGHWRTNLTCSRRKSRPGPSLWVAEAGNAVPLR